MPSPAFEEIVETFAFLDDWEDRYRHVIDLGKNFPALDEAFQTPAFKITGCASQVWLRPIIRDRNGTRIFDFEGTSDALIVRGLIAILHALYAGLPLAEVGKTDAMAQLARLGLHEHLSSQRSNGLRAMITRIHEVARAA